MHPKPAPICAISGRPVDMRAWWPVWDIALGIVSNQYAWALQEARSGFQRKDGTGTVLAVINLLEASENAHVTQLCIAYLEQYATTWCHYNTPPDRVRAIKKEAKA